MKNKRKKEQRLFNKMMEHLIAPPILVIFGSILFNIIVQIPYTLLTTNLAFDKYNSMYIPFDITIEKICNGFTVLSIVIAMPFFIKGLFLMKKYMELTKKEA